MRSKSCKNRGRPGAREGEAAEAGAAGNHRQLGRVAHDLRLRVAVGRGALHRLQQLPALNVCAVAGAHARNVCQRGNFLVLEQPRCEEGVEGELPCVDVRAGCPARTLVVVVSHAALDSVV